MTIELDFKSRAQAYCARVEHALETWLPPADKTPTRLHQAMRYSVLSGGKRIRPILVYATGQAFGVPIEQLDGPACAVELIHAYSLIHDDLPAMDNDDLRRGLPTCHRKFDEATAILAGDALQTLAFTVLADDATMRASSATRVRMLSALAHASGANGMCGGQAIDLAAVGQTLTHAEVENMHAHKTGALIRCAVVLGAESADTLMTVNRAKLERYAYALGLAFQVRDDILDIEGDTAVIGKTQGADMARNKPTYPSLLGLDGAKCVADSLHEQALDALSGFDQRADTLRDLSAYVVRRKS